MIKIDHSTKKILLSLQNRYQNDQTKQSVMSSSTILVDDLKYLFGMLDASVPKKLLERLCCEYG